MQLDLFTRESAFDITEEIFQAYFDCRKTKRNTINALCFEKHFEHNLFRLVDDIVSGAYQPNRSIAFIVNKPVKREIFAADFRDRVVHHFIINKLNPYFENIFIADSFACRQGKGTHYGINQVNRFIQECSDNYTSECYILKLDIQGFFMHIHKGLLFENLLSFIDKKYAQPDKTLLIELCRKIIFNDPTKNCIIKGQKKDWDGLPDNKSLFHSPVNCGLPIGNFTSQVFANFYMDPFDQFIKKELGILHYGRYVDDFVIIHPDKEYLKNLLPVIRDFLQTRLHLTLHPQKIYLQHQSKGFAFLGTVIKPNRIYISNRIKGNFYKAIQRQNRSVVQYKPDKGALSLFLSTMNSYLGIMKHHQTYKLRKKMLFKNLSALWWNYVYLTNGISKFVLKRKSYTP